MTPKPSKQAVSPWRGAIINAVLAAVLVAVTWSVLDNNSRKKHAAMAHSLAKMLAQQAADQVLADDMLALQNIVRRTAQLPNIHYAGVYDAAGTPLSEAGTVAGIANTFTASATVYAQSTQLGIASISIETPADQRVLLLLLLPLLAGVIGFWRRPQAQAASTETSPSTDFFGLEPLLYIHIHADYHDFDTNGAAAKLDQAATLIAKLYGARIEKLLGGYLFRFNRDKDPSTRACCVARLWYGSFQHYQQQTGFTFGAAALLTAYPSLQGTALQQNYEHNRWLLDTIGLAQTQQGILLNYDFMSLQGVAQSVIVRDDTDCFRLKSLKSSLDKLVRKQLAQVVKTLNRK